MKLIRYRQSGAIKTGVIVHETVYDTSNFCSDYNEQFFQAGGLNKLRSYVENNLENLKKPEEDSLNLDAPIARPSKIVCIGLNYADHAREAKMEVPAEPVVFLKSTSSWSGPNDDIIIPRGSGKTDWEVELAILIDKKASYVEVKDAMEYVGGYLLVNDVSEREFQLERNGTWDKGKGCDSFLPAGPFLVTKDEVRDVINLNIWLKVNGEIKQSGSTADLIFTPSFIVSYVSRFMTLFPGDIICTGTPAGVGMGFSPQIFLQPGDVVELGIDGLGSSRQNVIAYKPIH